MDFFLGFDGGGSRTRAALCSADGRVQAAAEAGPANPHHAGWDGCARHLREAFEAAVMRASERAPDGLRVRGAFFGLAGISSQHERDSLAAIARSWPELSGAAVGIDHDIRVAWAGAFGGAPGIALIAGTGSSAYGRNATGGNARCGGWGALVDDVGSGYWLSVEAIRAALHAHDGRGGATSLLAEVLRFLGLTDPLAIPGTVHGEGMTRDRLAGLAPLVFQHADAGDRVARDILARGAFELARLAEALQRQLFEGGIAQVALTGGLGARASYVDELRSALKRIAPRTELVAPRASSLAGAVILAAVEAGQPLPTDLKFTF
ncbi:BadF/BadG/BcrA/BcrD ATPase family protein [Nibricoccus sp. IMCC34717]|uniref:BadF/BadG/BcrA/BcrD ATPase family protein n=1 Tax=Nibricoccus sp. IMCC34717 TaxID=3034021 RepID=UPI00384CC63B